MRSSASRTSLARHRRHRPGLQLGVGAASVKTNAPNADRFEKKTSSSGSPYFVLKAANGEVIGVSEMYSSTSARDNGIGAVQRAAAVATTEDQTRLI